MTTTDQGVVNPTPAGVIGVTDQKLQLSVNQVVALAVALGATAVGLAFWFADTAAGPYQLGWLPGPSLLFVMVALTCTAELVAVRMRHDDDAVEELTLIDGVVLLNTLVLPIREALLVSLAGILLAVLGRRISATKVLYNMGVYASASTVAALLIHAIAPADEAFDHRLLLALAAAASAFVAINLAHMVLLLGALNGQRPWDIARQDAPLSMLTTFGTVCLTATVLVLAVAAPVLLPCVVLPAAALRYAYGASAGKHEERRRSARVLEYSQVLASGPTREGALRAFLHLVQREFEADTASAIFTDGSGFHIDPGTSALQPVALTVEHARLLAVPEMSLLSPVELPFGSDSAMVAPLTVDGQRVGTVVIATTGRARLRPPDLTTLSPLVGSLAVALQNADQMEQLVEETSKLRSVVDQATDGIVVLGRDDKVQVWSPAMTSITGVSASAAIGAPLSELITPQKTDDNALDLFHEVRRQLSPQSPQASVDIRLLRIDGEPRSTRFSHAAAFEDGVLVRDVVIVRDLTAEWRVERMKSDFIATVSHELRTPLTPLKGYADMLRKRGDTLTPEKRTRALDVIVDRAEHLGRLVEDLLAASTITADQQQPTHSMTTEVADLNALMRRGCEDFPADAGRINLESVPGPVWVSCDPTRAVQVASNMLSNALKYSSDPVAITVDKLDGQGRLQVRDLGLGIPADQLERVFDKFHRVEDPMVMSTGGTGLGLFIARHLARTMGGDLIAESTLGVGSLFTLLLPSATPDGQIEVRAAAVL